jgi:hypothetical protein
MKMAFVILCIFSAAFAGFSSARYEATRTAKLEANRFLREFTTATDVTSYLERSGQQEWVNRLKLYGLAGPTGYMRALTPSTRGIALGLVGVACGLFGFLFVERKTRPNRCNAPVPTPPQ